MKRRIARRGSDITKNGDEFAGDEREIVSVLNVFKTSVDTINASSITSDMTIGANLNGGSLTLGAVNSVTNINSNITNIATGGLTGSGRVFIASETNTSGSYVHIGSSTLSGLYLRGKDVYISDTGLSATGRIHIASGVNGVNAAGSEVYVGSTSLSRCFIRGGDVNINHTTGGSIYMGSDTAGTTNILGAVNIGTLNTATGNIIIGNNSAPGYTLISSKGITMNKFLGDGQYIDIAAEANTTTGYIILGSGNLQNNYIRGRNVNINSDTNGDVKLCNGTGNLYIYSPLFPQYPVTKLTGNNLASLSYIGGAWTVDSHYLYTMNTTYTAYSPLNNIPNGQYIFQVYVFTTAVTVSTEVSCTLCYSHSAMSNGQTTGFFTLFGNEHWTTSSTVGRFSMSACFMQDVGSPGNNLAVACRANSTLSQASIFYLKALRIA